MILSNLSNVSLQDLPSKDAQEKDGNSGSLGKRKRKATAVMKESLDQEKEQDAGKEDVRAMWKKRTYMAQIS